MRQVTVRGLSLLVFLLASALLSGCKPEFAHPVAPVPGPTVDASQYVGDWQVSETSGVTMAELGLPQNPVTGTYTLSIRDEPQVGLRAEYAGEWITETVDMPVTVTEITGTIVASVEFKAGAWMVGSLFLEDDGQRLVFTGVEYPAFRNAVLSAELPGEVRGRGTNYEHTVVEASSEQLRDFVLANSSVIYGPEDSLVEFVRSGNMAAGPPVASEQRVVHEAPDRGPLGRTAQVALVVLGLVVAGSIVVLVNPIHPRKP